MPNSSSVLSPLSVTKIRVIFSLTVFLKHGQMDLSKACNSISHHPTLIFPDFLGGADGSVRWVDQVGRSGGSDGSGGSSGPGESSGSGGLSA